MISSSSFSASENAVSFISDTFSLHCKAELFTSDPFITMHAHLTAYEPRYNVVLLKDSGCT